MRRFSKGQLAGTLFGLAFLGLVVYSAVSSITSTDRGAESAEKAVQELLDALSREDVLAVIGVMAPFEVGSSADLYPDIVDLAAAAGAIQSTDWLAGMDFAAEEIEMRSTLLHPDVAMVSMVSGRFEMNLDDSVADPALAELGGLRASLTVQEALGDIDDAMRRANRALEEVGISPFRLRAPDELFVMTVRHDGRWYVSASYTAAEYARQSLDLPAADFTASREDAPAGADSPSDVITDMVAVVNSRSLGEHWEALLADDPGGYFAPFDVLSPPDELGVFMDYTPAMEAFSQRLGEQMGVDASVFGNTAQIAGELFDVDGTVALDVSVREEPIGDNAVALHLESVSMQVDAELTDLSLGEVLYLFLDVDWTGLCLSGQAVLGNGSSRELAKQEWAERELPGASRPRTAVLRDGATREWVEFEQCLSGELRPAGFDEIFVVVSEVDGSWYISYVETALAYADLFVDHALNSPDFSSESQLASPLR